MNQQILDKLTAVLVNGFGYDPDKIAAESRIAEDLGADSLDKVEITMAVEEEWGIDFSDEDIEAFLTVGQLVDYIEKEAE